VKHDELSDGYAFRVDEKSIALMTPRDGSVWSGFCCPFLTFQLEASGSVDLNLTVRGPGEAKAILRHQFLERVSI